MMKSGIFFVVFFACVCATASFAQTENQDEKRIRFKRGENSATVSGAVARGETAAYVLKAKKDQLMTVKISSAESNAVFKIKNLQTGYFLNNAGEFDDAMEWEGVLPSGGEYSIIAGSTRGGAEYTLKVYIK